MTFLQLTSPSANFVLNIHVAIGKTKFFSMSPPYVIFRAGFATGRNHAHHASRLAFHALSAVGIAGKECTKPAECT